MTWLKLDGVTFAPDAGDFRASKLARAADRRESASEPTCDVAAATLSEVVYGLPEYHPLLKDSDARLAQMRATLDRFHCDYRRIDWGESYSHDLPARKFVPNLKPLGRPATAADVAAGKAIFALPNPDSPASLGLPAAATLKGAKLAPATVVQAETDAAGVTHYGIVTDTEVRAASAGELADIRTRADLDRAYRERVEKYRKQEAEKAAKAKPTTP